MNKRIILIFIWIFILVSIVLFFQWRTANVSYQLAEDKINAGDELSEVFIVKGFNLNELNDESKILFILSNETDVILSESFNAILFLEGNEIKFDSRENINYIFYNSGKYELDIIIFDIDYFVNKKIIVN